jgi:hypothetical protein
MIVSWLEAAPAAIAAMLWLLGAGVPVCYALGLRGIATWCVAPVLAPAIFGSAAVLCAWLNVVWSPVSAVVVVIMVATAGLSLCRMLRRRVGNPTSDRRSVKVAALLGSIIAACLGAVIITRGLGARHPWHGLGTPHSTTAHFPISAIPAMGLRSRWAPWGTPTR